jgi:hypothetical protein
MGPLRLAAAKRDILACGLVNHDREIVGRNAHRGDHMLVERPEQR